MFKFPFSVTENFTLLMQIAILKYERQFGSQPNEIGIFKYIVFPQAFKSCSFPE